MLEVEIKKILTILTPTNAQITHLINKL